MANYLDAAGLNQYTTALKNGTLKVGAAEAADSVPASGIDGIIPMANIPQGAQERLVVVADEAARLALTSANVQDGDTVKQSDTNIMYYVKDSSKLGTNDAADAFEVYRAGMAAHADSADNATNAAAAPWSGITNKPEEFTPAAHNQGSATINNLTGYEKAAAAADLAPGDNLNQALGKLEKKADDAAAAAADYAAIESTDIAAIIAGTWSA